MFMEEQGCAVEKNVLCQDNKSAVLLKKNGKLSSGERTKHINVRHFFIADRVAKGEVKAIDFGKRDPDRDYWRPLSMEVRILLPSATT